MKEEKTIVEVKMKVPSGLTLDTGAKYLSSIGFTIYDNSKKKDISDETVSTSIANTRNVVRNVVQVTFENARVMGAFILSKNITALPLNSADIEVKPSHDITGGLVGKGHATAGSLTPPASKSIGLAKSFPGIN